MPRVTDLILPILGIAVIAAIGVALAKKKPAAAGKSTEAPTKRAPLTEREQSMFFRLTESFPDHVVLAQVAFSALLDAKSQSARNTFDRKVADFVLFTKGFEAIAAIELDDASHRSKKARDAERDEMLKKAGYAVLRFKNVPDSADLKLAVAALSASPKAQARQTT